MEKNGKCETQGKPENGGVSEKLEQYRDLLMTDLYLRENVKSRPTFARDLSDSKDFVREFSRGKRRHQSIYLATKATIPGKWQKWPTWNH